jgi:hypothetical protein
MAITTTPPGRAKLFGPDYGQADIISWQSVYMCDILADEISRLSKISSCPPLAFLGGVGDGETGGRPPDRGAIGRGSDVFTGGRAWQLFALSGRPPLSPCYSGDVPVPCRSDIALEHEQDWRLAGHCPKWSSGGAATVTSGAQFLNERGNYSPV